MDIPEAITDLRNLKINKDKRVWRPFMEKYDCQTVCEIGVFAGRNFFGLIQHKPQLAVAIDAWINDGITSHNDAGLSQVALDKEYMNFVARMADKPFVKIYREFSSDAVKHFPDEYFDLVYVDGDHTYEGSLNDIENWFPKVKKGKFLIGDDYTRTVDPPNLVYDVKRAVNDYSKKNNLTAYEIPGNQWATGWAIIKP